METLTPFAPQLLALEGVTPQPWKNGGGVTRELAAWPLGSSMSDFDWRVSVADIAVDWPFSAFPGIDRQIMLLDGAGVRLQASDGSFDKYLDLPYQPFAFAGEVALDSTLLNGPTRDLNVMTRRGKVRAEVELVHTAFEQAYATASVLVAVNGDWAIQSGQDAPIMLHRNDALVWHAADTRGRAHCAPASRHGEAALIRITFHPETVL